MKALISVYNKQGILPFANRLTELGCQIISAGSVSNNLDNAGILKLDVAGYTKSPEIIGGRVKTLHHKIYAGILGRYGIDNRAMEEAEIPFIDLVVANLCPIKEITRSGNCDINTLLNSIDVGGKALIYAAAVNWHRVAVLVDPADYSKVRDELASKGACSDETRKRLMLKAFRYTAQYERAINSWLNAWSDREFLKSA